MRYIFLLILIGLSITAFVLYIKPRYEIAREAKTQVEAYSSNLDTAEKLKTSREELIARYNNIPKADLDNLKTLLPDSVDNIRLIIQIDSLAVRNGLSTVRGVNYQVQDKNVGSNEQAQSVSRLPYEEFVISFETTGQYQNFLSFLADLERNLRIVDITKIEFSPSTTAGTTSPATSMSYRITLKTYWLKQ
jgi:Tfp pilus assembly protein PilO